MIITALVNLKLEDKQLAQDYETHSSHYNNLQTAFYKDKLYQQCERFNQQSNWVDNPIMWKSLYTNKYVLTDTQTYASVGRNVADTHWVEDVYYNITKVLWDNDHVQQQGRDIFFGAGIEQTKNIRQWLIITVRLNLFKCITQ